MLGEWLSIDFETRSAVNLKKTGVYPYAADPSTDIWCMAWAIDQGPVELWEMGDPVPWLVAEFVRQGGKLRAWNAQFERVVWRGILSPRYGFPMPAISQWFDTAAQGAAMALPRALENASKAMGLPVQKDMDGHRLMLQMAKPRRLRGRGSELVWWDDRERRTRLGEYCKQDVEVERQLANCLRPLSEDEREIYILDQRINDRGISIDRDAVDGAVNIMSKARSILNSNMITATDGEVTATTQSTKLKEWLQKWVFIENVRKSVLERMLQEGELPQPVEDAIRIRLEGSKTSTAKLKSMQAAAPEGRARGLVLYHAAGTGRWGGKLIQPQNMPRAAALKDKEIAGLIKRGFIANEDEAYDGLAALARTGDYDLIRRLHGAVPNTISGMLRNFIIAGQDKEFIVCDYSNIEGRVIAWLAGERWKIDAFLDFDAGMGADIYKLAYAKAFGVEVSLVSKDQRQIGKVMELALGFGGGVGAFQTMAGGLGVSVTDDEADELKFGWRQAHPNVVALWNDLENAAMDAIRCPGVPQTVADGRLTFVVAHGFLWMILPSGRALAYCAPQIRNVWTPWGEKRPGITFLGENSVTRKWGIEKTYGGKLTENAVQAIARDIMAYAMMRLERAGYPIVMSVHDEIIAEMLIGQGSRRQMAAIMCEPQAWNVGCPIVVGANDNDGLPGWRGRRYRK